MGGGLRLSFRADCGSHLGPIAALIGGGLRLSLGADCGSHWGRIAALIWGRLRLSLGADWNRLGLNWAELEPIGSGLAVD